MHEFDILKLINQKVTTNSYLGDDTAYLEELDIVVTTDTLVEDVHFDLKTTSAFDLGFKSLAVNLSDIASAGAIPAYAFISLSIPKYLDEKFIAEFYDGMNELSVRHSVQIAGGDITSSSKFVINITVLGKMQGIKPARRSNAKVGDIVITTGFYGSSKIGFEILKNEKLFKNKCDDFILERFKEAHRKPQPHLGFGRIIAQNSQPAPCMMDTSDGLADAAFKIAQSSGVNMEIQADLIPVSPDLMELAPLIDKNWLDIALFGGEDYTLLSCVSNETLEILQKNNIPVRRIGKILPMEENVPKVKIQTETQEFIITEKILQEKSFNHWNI